MLKRSVNKAEYAANAANSAKTKVANVEYVAVVAIEKRAFLSQLQRYP